MKFKVLKGTGTFDKLEQLSNKFIEMKKIRTEVLEKLGAKQFTEPGFCKGGLYGVVFEEKPEGWAKAYNKNRGPENAYVPIFNRKSNKDVIELIASVPTISYDDMWKCIAIKYDSFCKSPGIDWYIEDGYVLLDMHDDWDEVLHEDCIEITNREHKLLSIKNDA